MGVWHVLVVALMISLLLRNILSNKLLLPKKTLCHLSRLWQEKKESNLNRNPLGDCPSRGCLPHWLRMRTSWWSLKVLFFILITLTATQRVGLKKKKISPRHDQRSRTFLEPKWTRSQKVRCSGPKPSLGNSDI